MHIAPITPIWSKIRPASVLAVHPFTESNLVVEPVPFLYTRGFETVQGSNMSHHSLQEIWTILHCKDYPNISLSLLSLIRRPMR